MTFPEHILSARPWGEALGSQTGSLQNSGGCPEGIDLVSHRTLGFRGWGDPSAGEGGAGVGAGIPQLGEGSLEFGNPRH